MIKLKTAFESVKTQADMRAACDKVVDLIKTKKISIDDLSIREIATSIIGTESVESMMKYSDGVAAMESVAPVNLSAFTNITGNLIFEGIVESFQAATPIGSLLVKEESARRDGGRDIGFANIDDDTLVVEEGEEYPDMKFGEDYIDIPTSKKRGAKIGLTREAIFFDETGKILDQARAIGERMGTNKEKRILRTVLGLDNTFSRKGVARSTYVASADPRINLQTGTPLVDWTSIDSAMNVFNNMNDDRTNPEPINVVPNTILVPQQLEMTAKRIFSATEIRHASSSGNIQTYSGNPLTATTIITSPWIKKLLMEAGASANVAGARWFYGDFKRAFRYRTLFPLAFRAAMHDKDDFERDVVAQFRVDERGTPRIVAPWYVAQYDAA
jgi:hypothetical protein